MVLAVGNLHMILSRAYESQNIFIYSIEIECNVAGVSGIVRVMCESNNPLESPGTCTLDSSEEESFNFSCNTFIILTLMRVILIIIFSA